MFGLAGQASAFLDVIGVLVGLDYRLEHTGNLLGADLVGLATFSGLDDLAEGDSPPHRLRRFGAVLMDAKLRERFPATDDLGGIVHAERVVLVLQ